MEWISVKDKMPGTYESVVVFDGKGVYDDVMLVSDDGTFRTHALGYDYDQQDLKNVTHWMYLPEPPKI